MKVYKRQNPHFSLCGLNCVLCPRFHTDGNSKCPGCGGDNFYEKHPSCPIISCSLKHNNIEFCFDCNEFPCKRYIEPSTKDSFITYKKRQENIQSAKNGLKKYLNELEDKKNILIGLLENYNDGRMKNFYCIAVNLFPLIELKQIIRHIHSISHDKNMEKKKLANISKNIFTEKADELGIEIELRK